MVTSFADKSREAVNRLAPGMPVRIKKPLSIL